MCKFTTRVAAVALAAAFVTPAFADDAKQGLKNVMEQQKQEVKQQGDRQVQVPEKAIWGLGELPPDLMTKAMDQLASEPDMAKLKVMQAANILQLTAAMSPDNSESQMLMEQADTLRKCAFKIETRQVISKSQLKEPFARASLAAAKYYQASAKMGLQKQDEEKTGYSLKGASAYLTAAHVFSGREPTAEVSRAAYDANVLAGQIIKGSKPTTEGKTSEMVASNRGQDQGENKPAALPPQTEQPIANLASAAGSVNLDEKSTASVRD